MWIDIIVLAFASFSYGNRKIARLLTSFTPETYVTTFMGSGVHLSSDGFGSQSSFKSPCGLTFDSSRSYMVVTDSTDKFIRVITLSNKQIRTLTITGIAVNIDLLCLLI